MSKKVLFLVPYPLGEAPSQRFRFEQYFSLLQQNGFQFSVKSFLTKKNWQLFFRSGHLLPKGLALATGLFKRVICLLTAAGYDFVFIHRELTPFGPPILEWVLAKVLRKKIIYDFDDAIWLTDRSQEFTLVRFLKWRSKVKSICKWSFKVSCGNEYLCSFARKYNDWVILNPTTIDTRNWHNPDLFAMRSDNLDKITIGWTGSHSTLKYLNGVEPILQRIDAEFPSLHFLVIADQKPALKLKSLLFVQWSAETEIEELLKFDIGIMPLPDDDWSRGKCGFKALQYMALRIPAVVSAVGVNSSIIDNGKDGFLCSNAEQWEIALRKLIQEQRLREEMGANGRKKVIEHYSVMSNSSNFLSLFE